MSPLELAAAVAGGILTAAAIAFVAYALVRLARSQIADGCPSSYMGHECGLAAGHDGDHADHNVRWRNP